MSQRESFKARNGKDASGVLREPAGSGKAPGLLLIQEYWGVNDHIVDVTERFAKEGFVVLAVDLYHGRTTKSADEAGKLMGALDRAQAVEEIAGAMTHLAHHPRYGGKVGITGFCLGGALTFQAAATLPGLSAAVAFYGIPDMTKVDLSQIAIPLQAHFSKTDPWAKPELAEKVRQALAAKGVTMELHLYDAEHAFMNDTRNEVYSPESAKVAWGRAVAFLKKHLGAN